MDPLLLNAQQGRSRPLQSVWIGLASLLLLCSCTSPPAGSDSTVVNSGAEAVDMVAQCLNEAGWAASVDDDGSVNVQVPIEQAEAYEEASATCWGSIRLPSFSETTDGERERVYTEFIAIRECILDLEIQLPAAPTYQAWVDGGGSWAPHGDIPREELSLRFDEIMEKCPQFTG